MNNTTATTMPKRRGVVMRDGGVITDSYGTQYVRDEGTGQLYRIGPKRRGKKEVTTQS